MCFCLSVLAKQAEKEQEQGSGKRSRGKKRKAIARDSSEPLTKKPNTSPSPLVFSTISRPVSVMSTASSDITMNGGDMTTTALDVTGTEGVDTPLQISMSGPNIKRKHRGKTSAPLGGRGKFQKRKGAGGGSMSAAASAGAMAGALAASNAAFATLGYSLPTHHSPSPSNHSLSVVTQTHGANNSAQSSPRASPSPITICNTPPNSRHSVTSRTLLTHAKNS